MKIVQRCGKFILGIFCITLLSSCYGESMDQQKTGSGVTIDISTIIRGFVDAGLIVSASVHTLWSDAQQRAADIKEGTEKIKEGKEQLEKGVRGE